MRSVEKPSPAAGSSVTSRIAETPASTITISLPPSSTAASIASRTIAPSCGTPWPIAPSSSDAAVMPITTPIVSWIARSPRRPWVTPTQITAAIAANAGRDSATSAPASSQAATAAAAAWRIGRTRPWSRRRPVSRTEVTPPFIGSCTGNRSGCVRN